MYSVVVCANFIGLPSLCFAIQWNKHVNIEHINTASHIHMDRMIAYLQLKPGPLHLDKGRAVK